MFCKITRSWGQEEPESEIKKQLLQRGLQQGSLDQLPFGTLATLQIYIHSHFKQIKKEADSEISSIGRENVRVCEKALINRQFGMQSDLQTALPSMLDSVQGHTTGNTPINTSQ